MNLLRLKQSLDEINQIGDSDKGIKRLAYTDEEKLATNYFIQQCKKEGLYVREDECGNVIARREGQNPVNPAVVIGSHLDSVYNGGRYDGVLGVIAGLEIIRSLNEKNIETEYPIEIISFACEESARFGVSTIGSKAVTGRLSMDEIEGLKDKDGITIKEALASRGLNINRIALAKRRKEEIKAFFELHIEQGPLLEMQKKQIGIVEGIASPLRIEVCVEGKSSHSGTTPMNKRHDALLGSSEIVLAVERLASKEANKGTVATTGVLKVKDGAMNVIPGMVKLQIDIRSISSKSKQNVFAELKQFFEQVSHNRGLSITWNVLSNEEPVTLNKDIIYDIEVLCEENGISYLKMPSGAGHDAMNMASICPTCLLFVPSINGLSHHPDEETSIEDIGVGVELLEKIIRKYAVAKVGRTIL